MKIFIIERFVELHNYSNIQMINTHFSRFVDLANPQKNWTKNLFSYLLAWSNENPYVFNGLIQDFPESVKGDMNERLEIKIAENNGEFPASSQTYA